MSTYQRTPTVVVFLTGLLVLVFGVTVLGCSSSITDRSVDRVSSKQVVDWSDRSGTMLIDTRPASQFEAGRIPGAVNRRLASLPRDRKDREIAAAKRVIVYGQNPGSASALAFAKRLLEEEYGGVFYYEGAAVA